MALVFSDTFTEASDVALGSHTPEVGTGWNVIIGDINVRSDLDRATAANAGAGNRALCQDDFGTDGYDVEADIWISASATVFGGVIGRAQSASVLGPDFCEFTYDEGPGGWSLTAGEESDFVSEAFPTAPANVRLEVRNTGIKGYVNDVLKCEIPAVGNGNGRNWCGLTLGNFDTSVNDFNADNFTVNTVVASAIAAISSYYRMMGMR